LPQDFAQLFTLLVAQRFDVDLMLGRDIDWTTLHTTRTIPSVRPGRPPHSIEQSKLEAALTSPVPL
jgi:hypothetical protein